MVPARDRSFLLLIVNVHALYCRYFRGSSMSVRALIARLYTLQKHHVALIKYEDHQAPRLPPDVHTRIVLNLWSEEFMGETARNFQSTALYEVGGHIMSYTECDQVKFLMCS